MARVIVWTKRDGIIQVSPEMPEAEAQALLQLTKESLPKWAHVELEVSK